MNAEANAKNDCHVLEWKKTMFGEKHLQAQRTAHGLNRVALVAQDDSRPREPIARGPRAEEHDRVRLLDPRKDELAAEFEAG